MVAASEELIHPLSQVKASLALEQKRVDALRGALAETEGSDSGHSGGECESTSGDSSLEQVQLLSLESSQFCQFLFPGGFDPKSSPPTIKRFGFPLCWGLTI